MFFVTIRRRETKCFKRRQRVRALGLVMFSFINLFVSAVCRGQGFDLGSWNILSIKYNYNTKLSLLAEAQLRSLKLYNDFHYHEFKGGLNYKVLPNLRLTIAVGKYDTYREGGSFIKPKNNDEFRIWPQAILTQSLSRLKVEQRYRVELRFTSDGYRNRFRYRLGVSYPFGKENADGDKPFQVSASNELFFTNKEAYFERNRLFVSLNYKISKSTSFETGYLHQFDYQINDETGRDFLVIGLMLDLYGKRGQKATHDVDIRDN